MLRSRRFAFLVAAVIAPAAILLGCDRPQPAVLAYRVEGMHCEGCVAAITGKVTKVAGVTTCEVSLDGQSATVRVDDGRIAPQVESAIRGLGYTVKPNDGAAPQQPAAS
jgi:copper chaperone CopZ